MNAVGILGCGYVGLRAGHLLARAGVKVWGTTRAAAGSARLAEAGIEPHVADVLDPESLARLPEAGAVLFAVGFDRTAGPSVDDVYVGGICNALDVLGSRVGKWVHTSSTGVYGQSDGGWVDERALTQPTTTSARACQSAEFVLLGMKGLDSVSLRLAGLYGPGRLPRRASLERGEAITGDPDHWLNLVHVDDAAAFCVAALTTTLAERTYNVVDDRPNRRRDFYALMARLLGLEEPRYVSPGDSALGATLPTSEWMADG